MAFMQQARADIIAQLRKEVLLQRFSKQRSKSPDDLFIEPFAEAFPCGGFPTGVVHEFICHNEESFTASTGFVSGIVSSLMKNNGVTVWIGSSQKMFPPAFTLYKIRADKIIFISLDKPKDIIWTTEEALKCKGLSAVVCDVRELSFKQSRRLQLATEQSEVTGFILRNRPRVINTTACASRWIIDPAISHKQENMPGVGYPSWNVHLQKIKNGKPGSWTLYYKNGKFIHVEEQAQVIIVPRKKAV